MSSEPTTTPTGSERDLVEFRDSHRPSARAGKYRLRIHHSLGTQGSMEKLNPAPEVAFSILGERLALTDDLVHSVFPPSGGEGPFHNLLPHIVLRRSTLPWERTADGTAAAATSTGVPHPSPPWMALLLYAQGEAPAIRASTLGAERQGLGLGVESADHEDDPVSVIDVPRDTLARLLPRVSELARLAHVRSVRTVDSSGSARVEEQAVVVGSRVLEPEESWVAHLVSLEGRNPSLWQEGQPEKVLLLSLYRWSFRTSSAGKDLAGLLTHLEVRTASEGGRAVPGVDGAGRELPLRLDGGSATGHLHPPPGLPPEARPFLLAGYTLLPHALRTGDRTVSWYRGPLVPQAPAEPRVRVPVRSADSLLVLDRATGCFDASFAAAWELGRLLALEDAHFGVELLHWKRARRRGSGGDLPKLVDDWLDWLVELVPVPFDYLVPDEGLLPVESIRFFTVDPDWLACLVDGAFSLGRFLGHDQSLDEEHWETRELRRLSGVLLRSAAVSGYPGLEVDGYRALDPRAGERELDSAQLLPASFERLTGLAPRRLGPSVLLCLFEGDIDVVDLHVHPQAMHFGLDEVEGEVEKTLRSPEDGGLWSEGVRPSFRNGSRVLDVDKLYADIASIYQERGADDFSVGDFAFQLLEAPELVRFCRPAPEALSKIEGIAQARTQALEAAGIATLADLRLLLHQPESSWPQVDGCSSKMIRGWAHHAELLLIPGVDEHQAELLEDAGVGGLTNLARRDAGTLQPQLEELNAVRPRARWVPSTDRLSAWIREAARIVADIGEEET